MRPAEYFGTLQESLIYAWREHLSTQKYSVHKALEEYYESVLELTDELIECYQAEQELVRDYSNLLDHSDYAGVPLEYLQELKELTVTARIEFFEGSDELCSICDDILVLLNNTIYQLRYLKEETSTRGASIKDYL